MNRRLPAVIMGGAVAAAAIVSTASAGRGPSPAAAFREDARGLETPRAGALTTAPSPPLPPPLPPPAVASPRPADLVHQPPTDVTVPILMYHFVRVNPVAGDRLGFDLSVTPDGLAAQLDHLTAAGFHSVSLAQLADAMQGGAPLPEKPVVLTFDDGFADFATAAMPVLLAHHFTATAFVVSGFVGRPNYMNADQIRAAVAAGMTIGAHTAHHVDLTTAAPGAALQEIRSSRAELEALVRHPVLDFAYPSGRLNPTVERLVREAGFRDAVTTAPGRTHQAGAPYALKRVRVFGGESLTDFARSLAST